MKKKLLFGLLILALIAVPLSAIACEEEVVPPAEEEEEVVPPAEEEEEEAPLPEKIIKIGCSLPLTGPAAPYGLAGYHACDLAAEDINNAGGVVIDGVRYLFEVVARDDKYSVDRGVENIYNFLYAEDIKYIYLQASALNLAVAETLTKHKVILMHQSYNDQTIDPEYEYSFRLIIPGTMKGPAFFKWIIDNRDVETSSHMAPDDETGWAQAESDNANLEDLGVEVLDNIYFDRETTDFTPLLTRIIAKNPDMITCGGSPVGSMALIAKQARAMGYTGVLSKICPTSAMDVVPVVGAEAVEGVISTAMAFEAPMVSQRMLDLPERELAKYGEAYATTWDLYVYLPVLAAAMERAQSVEPEAVKQIWEDTTQEWPYYAFPDAVLKFGTPECIEFYGESGRHQAYYPFVIQIIQGGEDVNIALVYP